MHMELAEKGNKCFNYSPCIIDISKIKLVYLNTYTMSIPYDFNLELELALIK